MTIKYEGKKEDQFGLRKNSTTQKTALRWLTGYKGTQRESPRLSGFEYRTISKMQTQMSCCYWTVALRRKLAEPENGVQVGLSFWQHQLWE